MRFLKSLLIFYVFVNGCNSLQVFQDNEQQVQEYAFQPEKYNTFKLEFNSCGIDVNQESLNQIKLNECSKDINIKDCLSGSFMINELENGNGYVGTHFSDSKCQVEANKLFFECNGNDGELIYKDFFNIACSSLNNNKIEEKVQEQEYQNKLNKSSKYIEHLEYYDQQLEHAAKFNENEQLQQQQQHNNNNNYKFTIIDDEIISNLKQEKNNEMQQSKKYKMNNFQHNNKDDEINQFANADDLINLPPQHSSQGSSFGSLSYSLVDISETSSELRQELNDTLQEITDATATPSVTPTPIPTTRPPTPTPTPTKTSTPIPTTRPPTPTPTETETPVAGNASSLLIKNISMVTLLSLIVLLISFL